MKIQNRIFLYIFSDLKIWHVQCKYFVSHLMVRFPTQWLHWTTLNSSKVLQHIGLSKGIRKMFAGWCKVATSLTSSSSHAPPVSQASFMIFYPLIFKPQPSFGFQHLHLHIATFFWLIHSAIAYDNWKYLHQGWMSLFQCRFILQRILLHRKFLKDVQIDLSWWSTLLQHSQRSFTVFMHICLHNLQRGYGIIWDLMVVAWRYIL